MVLACRQQLSLLAPRPVLIQGASRYEKPTGYKPTQATLLPTASIARLSLDPWGLSAKVLRPSEPDIC